MKKILQFLVICVGIQLLPAQIINFADINFKNALLAIPGIDTNSDGQITQQEAAAYSGSNVSGEVNAIKIENNNLVGSVAEILYFTNLKYFELTECPQVTVVNLSMNAALATFKYKIVNGKYNLMGFTPNNSIKNIYMESSSSIGLNNAIIYTPNQLFTFKTILDFTNLSQLQKLDLIGSLPLTINNSSIVSGNMTRINLDLAPFRYNNMESLVLIDVVTGLQNLQFLKVRNVKGNVIGGNTTIRTNINLTQAINLKNLFMQWIQIQGSPLETPFPSVSYPNPNNIEIFTLGYSYGFTNFFLGNTNYYSSFSKLQELYINTYTDLLELNLDNNILLKKLHLESIVNLRKINLKNVPNLPYFYFNDLNQNWKHLICVDDVNFYNATYPSPRIDYSTCVTPANQFNTLNGRIFMDVNGNQCADQIPLANIRVSANGTITQSDNLGNYMFRIPILGQITTNPLLPNGTYSPANDVWTTTQFGQTRTANFCVNPNTLIQNPDPNMMMNDAGIVTYWGNGVARPGGTFCEQVKIVNNYATAIIINPTLTFNNQLVLASADAGGMLANDHTVQWSNVVVPPYSSVTLNACFSVPPSFMGGETLTFTSGIGDSYTDDYAENNTHSHTLTVVNSMDPNDKHVQQGSSVHISKVNDYLEYKIRFQNEGTADAINIMIQDILDADLNPSSFEILSSSHPVRLEMVDNTVKFYFDNINLTWAANNEAESQGWVVYRIKPLSTIAEGTDVKNTADIYFDYNAPITTNTTTTTYIGNAGTSESQTENFVKIYPNPVSQILKIDSKEKIEKLEIFDSSGRIIVVKISADRKIDVSNLKAGTYFLKVTQQSKKSTVRFIKK